MAVRDLHVPPFWHGFGSHGSRLQEKWPIPLKDSITYVITYETYRALAVLKSSNIHCLVNDLGTELRSRMGGHYTIFLKAHKYEVPHGIEK